MVVYRRVWQAVVVAAVACGVAAAVMLAPPSLVFLFGSMGAVAGVAVARDVAHGQGRHRTAARAGAFGATAMAAIIGAAHVAGPPGLGVAALLALTSPPAASRILSALGRHRGRVPKADTHRSDGVANAAAPDAGAVGITPLLVAPGTDWGDLSDAELCLAWRRSFTGLQACANPEQVAVVAQVRAECLDELEQRHPAAFKVWLDSGARAGSDPARYLSRTPPP